MKKVDSKEKIHFRCSLTDKKHWEELAREESLTLSAWIRQICNAGWKNRNKPRG